MDQKALQEELHTKVNKSIAPLFSKYNIDFSSLEATMRWKPIVLVIGNYSSGKSTLINEILGHDIQRTGQAPTDDAFTILTAEGVDKPPEIPGSTLVNDQQLPFVKFKRYGERLISHMCLKNVNAEVLENMAIIDSPGMLDSTSEKDRGYNYMTVLGEFAKMADLIVLMFDPHKAGTIKETYNAIRNTLPEKSGEDRIIFVMSRIDECENLSDLVRSYGTLCWNMSQMTGRKDIPHIYLTYSQDVSQVSEAWPQERGQLKDKINNAPALRINHILEDIDRQLNELQIVAEAMTEFAKRGKDLLWQISKFTLIVAVGIFFSGDLLLKTFTGFPEETFLSLLQAGKMDLMTFVVPGVLALFVLLGGWMSFANIGYKQLLKRSIAKTKDLVMLDNEYRKNLWDKMEPRVIELLQQAGVGEVWANHTGNLTKVQRFLTVELKAYYDKIRK